MQALYHKDVYLPDTVRPRWGLVELAYGPHSRKAAATDRYGAIALPAFLDTDRAELIEVETNLIGQPVKALYRTRYSWQYDLCIVVNFDGFVRTVWLNEVNDFHYTLRDNKYARATA